MLTGTCLEALLAHVDDAAIDRVRKGALLTLERVLVLAAADAEVSATARDALDGAPVAPALLRHYATTVLQPRLEGESSDQSDQVGLPREEAILHSLVSLFVAAPSRYGAFCALAPAIFRGRLALGSAARERFNAHLLADAFEVRLEKLISATDEIVTSDFFWNAEVMPLCTKARIAASYAALNEATATSIKTGESMHLYSRLLALLLRLSAHRGGDASEIARRTREVLDQFAREPEQQAFMLTSERLADAPDLRAQTAGLVTVAPLPRPRGLIETPTLWP